MSLSQLVSETMPDRIRRRPQLSGEIFGQVNQAGITDTGANVGAGGVPSRQATDVDDSSPSLFCHEGASSC